MSMNTLNAIKSGDIDLIKERIQTREIHKGYKYEGLSALHLAIIHNQIGIAEILIKAGANINLPAGVSFTYNIKSLYTPIHVAIQYNNLKAFLLLIQSEAILTVYDHHTETPLILAIKNNAQEISSTLIQKGAYNLANKQEMNILLSLVIERGDCRIIKALVHSGLNVDFKLEGGKSILILAVEKRNVDIVQLLLNAGADVKFCYLTSSGHMDTALISAIKNGALEISSILIKKEAYNLTNDREIKSLLSLALEHANREVVKALIYSGLNVDFLPDGLRSILIMAVEKRDTDIIKLMINAKADVDFHYDAVDGYRKTALYESINRHYPEIVKTLIDADASVNFCVRSASAVKLGRSVIATGEKTTFLSLAISQKLPAITKMLVEAGADFNSRFYDGDLFHLAIRSGDSDTIRVMLEHGVAKDILNSVLKNCPHITGFGHISKLIEEVTNIRLSNNDNILNKFTSYLASDKDNPLFPLPKEIIREIVGYSIDSEITLDSRWCDNYIKYNPLTEATPPSLAGEV